MRQGLLWLSERQGIFNFVRRNGMARKFASRFVAGRDDRDRRAGGEGARRARHHPVARPAGRERHGRGRGGGGARPLPPDARPDGRERRRGQRLGQAHPDGPRYRRGPLPRQHGPHPRQGEGARRVRPARHGGLRLHPADARLLPPAALRRVRQALRRGDPVHAPALGAGRRGPDRDAGAGPALQGRLPRAAGGGVPRQGRRGPQLRDADAAAAGGGELPRPRHPRRGHHRAGARVRRAGSGSATSGSSSRCSTACGATSRSRLRQAGHNMRVYIPFGTQWYPYLMRRLAERPANIAFLLGNVVRESIPGR